MNHVLNMADLIRSAREIGAYPPRTHSNPLSRELTDRELEAKILASAEAVAKADAKQARKAARKAAMENRKSKMENAAAATDDIGIL